MGCEGTLPGLSPPTLPGSSAILCCQAQWQAGAPGGVQAGQPPFLPQDLRCVLVMATLGAVLVAALLVHTLLLPSHGSVGSWEAVPHLDNSCSDPCQ